MDEEHIAVNERNFARNDIILRPDGTKITRNSLMADAINFYQTKYSDDVTEVCDFSEGSEIRTLHESFIVELFSLYLEMYRTAKMKFVLDSEGVYLDRLGCEHHLSRGSSTHATGSVTFSTNETLNGNYTIPEGTIILAHNTGYEYKLLENVIIRSSAKPENGIVESVLAGSKYNAEPGKLTTFKNISTINYGITVTNHSPITGGDDEESDNSFKIAILQAKREKSWGTATQYDNFIRSIVSGVHDIQFVEPSILKADKKLPQHYKSDNKTVCTDCTRVLFVNGFVKPCNVQVLNDVEYAMTQQNNLVIGQLFHVQSAEPIKLVFGMELWCSTMVSDETIIFHLEKFFDGGIIETKRGSTEYPGMNIGEKVTKNDLLNVIENIPGVEQCGTLHRLKYDNTLSDDYRWMDNADNTYTYTDDEGYTFTKGIEEEDYIDPWGWANFSEITCSYGQVLTVGVKDDYDDGAESLIDLSVNLIDEKTIL